MTTANAEAPATGVPEAVVRGWDRFWFQPGDPTVLGMVRILVGLIALYVHWAYSYDLLAMVGGDGWINAKTMDEFRKDVPFYDRSSAYDTMGERGGHQFRPEDLTAEELQFRREWDGNSKILAARRGYFAWSIFYHVTDPFWVWVVHVGFLVVFFLFTIGFCTRITSVLAWLGALSYVQRHYVAFFGMDTIMSFLLLYLMIGPSGAALSVDRLILRFVHAWRTLRGRNSPRKAGALSAAALRKAEGLELDRPTPRVSATLALRCIQIHVCIVYLASGLSKLAGPAWWNGTAIWGTMVNPEFSPVGSETYVKAVRFLCEHEALWQLFVSGGALFTLLFEISMIYTIWNRRLRWVLIASAVMLHTGIAFFMGLTTFSLIMIAAVSSFIPLEALQRFLRFLTYGRTRFTLAYAPSARRQVRVAALVRTVDPWNQVQLKDHAALRRESDDSEGITTTMVDRKSAGPLQLITSSNEVLTGYPLFVALARALPVNRVIALLLVFPIVISIILPRYSALGWVGASILGVAGVGLRYLAKHLWASKSPVSAGADSLTSPGKPVAAADRSR